MIPRGSLSRNATRSRFFIHAFSLDSCHRFTQWNQGLQISTEAASFGSFSHSFLSAFRDDFPKLSILHFQFLAEPDPQSLDLDSPVGIKSLLLPLADNSLAVLGEVTESPKRCSVYRRRSRAGHYQRTHPPPTILEIREYLQHVPVLRFGFRSHGVGYPSYEVFIPLSFVASFSRDYLNRLTHGSEAMAGVLNQLNWRNDTRFAQLSGVFPVEPGIPFQDGVVDFSAVTNISDKVSW